MCMAIDCVKEIQLCNEVFTVVLEYEDVPLQPIPFNVADLNWAVMEHLRSGRPAKLTSDEYSWEVYDFKLSWIYDQRLCSVDMPLQVFYDLKTYTDMYIDRKGHTWILPKEQIMKMYIADDWRIIGSDENDDLERSLSAERE